MAGVVALLAGVWLGKFLELGQTPVISVSASTCHLNDPSCLISHDNITVELALQPQPIPLLKEVQVRGKVQGLDEISRAHLEITGVSMEMGRQIVPLQFNPDNQQLSGSFQLPICSVKSMSWQALLLIHSSAGSYQFSYPFTTSLP